MAPLLHNEGPFKTNMKIPPRPPRDTGGLARKSLPPFSIGSVINSPKLPWAIVAIVALALLFH